VIDKIHKTNNFTYYAALQRVSKGKVVIQKPRSSRASALGAIRQQPFCPRVLDRFSEEGKQFVVFEELGVNLAVLMAHNSIGCKLKASLVKQLVDAVVTMHELGTPLPFVSPALFFLRVDRLFLVELPYEEDVPLRYQSPEGLRGWACEASPIFSLGLLLAEIII
jgi:hypothetical protein